MMQATCLEWIPYLEMLSVERTEKFLLQLSLPFEDDSFLSVMNWARAHLEVHILSSNLNFKEKKRNSSLNEVWKEYRAISGVLKEKNLISFAENYYYSRTFNDLFYSEVNKLVKPNTAAQLNSWFRENFINGSHPDWLWFFSLRELITINNQNDSRINPPLSDDEYDLINTSCANYYSAQRLFEIQFCKIEEVEESSGPSTWERVLQHSPADERPLKYFPWLRSIKKCIWNRYIRYEWTKLRSVMSIDRMNSIIDRARQSRIFLTWNQAIHEEPKPLYDGDPKVMLDVEKALIF